MGNIITYKLAIDSDIEAINSFYNRIYGKNRTTDQFNWEFNSSPAGKSIYVIALDLNKIIGTQCVIPYYIIDATGSITLTGKSEDTLVDPGYRGQSIFENMYALLIEECRKAGLRFIWGFTYAKKPFQKLGFDIPYQSQIGLIVLNTPKAYQYYSNLSSNNSIFRKMKILGLCIKSRIKYSASKLKYKANIKFTTEKIPLNSDVLNYLNGTDCFGLLLDKDFLNYRMYNNAYSSNYFQYNSMEGNNLNASVMYTINNGIGYILHVYFKRAEDTDWNTNFLYSSIQNTLLSDCVTIRFWGFRHNTTNKNEVRIFENLNFTFIKNGISFVGLDLNEEKTDWNKFMISRLASQGTD